MQKSHNRRQCIPGAALSTILWFLLSGIASGFVPTRYATLLSSSRNIPMVTTVSHRFVFGGMFETDEKKSDDLLLAVYPNLGSSDLKFDSLVEYTKEWAKLFEGKGMGLTTPVKIKVVDDFMDKAEGVAKASGVEIVFQRVQSGYADKDKQENKDKKDKKEKKQVKQGGVAVIVEQLNDDQGTVQVRAQRCEMDEDTMIKEMSEETILKELNKAVGVWKKDH